MIIYKCDMCKEITPSTKIYHEYYDLKEIELCPECRGDYLFITDIINIQIKDDIKELNKDYDSKKERYISEVLINR